MYIFVASSALEALILWYKAYHTISPCPKCAEGKGKKGNVFVTRQIRKAGLGVRFLGSSLNARDKPLCSDHLTFQNDYAAKFFAAFFDGTDTRL